MFNPPRNWQVDHPDWHKFWYHPDNCELCKGQLILSPNTMKSRLCPDVVERRIPIEQYVFLPDGSFADSPLELEE